MPSVELQRALSVPAVPARSAISAIMNEIAEHRGEWADFALYLNFGSLGLPDVGYVAIPVTISDLNESTEPRHEIRFKMRARRSPEAFPTFEGALGIDLDADPAKHAPGENGQSRRNGLPSASIIKDVVFHTPTLVCACDNLQRLAQQVQIRILDLSPGLNNMAVNFDIKLLIFW